MPSPDPFESKARNGGRAEPPPSGPAASREELLQEVEGLRRRIRELEAEAKSFRDTEATLRGLFRVAPVGIGTVTADRRLGWANEQMTRITGYAAEELSGKSARILYETDDEFEWVGRVKHGEIRIRGIGSVETRWKRKDGTLIDVFVSSTALDPRDLGAGIMYTALDITEWKRAETALRESEENFRTLTERASDGILIGRVDGTHAYLNHRAAEITGYTFEEFRNLTVRDLVGPRQIDRLMDNLRRRIDGEAIPHQYEVSILRKDGVWIPVEITAARTVWKGEPAVIVILRDITERKRIDAELATHREHLEDLVERRTRELESSREQARRAERLASIGTLAAGIAHEINNPIGGILLSAEITRTREDLPEDVTRSLDTIIEYARRSRDIIRNVRRFAQAQTTDKAPGNLNTVVETARQLTDKYAKEHACSIETDLASELPPIRMNRTGLDQVVVNLLRNAIEAGAETIHGRFDPPRGRGRRGGHAGRPEEVHFRSVLHVAPGPRRNRSRTQHHPRNRGGPRRSDRGEKRGEAGNGLRGRASPANRPEGTRRMKGRRGA
jgi:PAS domain S-box-containing protein